MTTIIYVIDKEYIIDHFEMPDTLNSENRANDFLREHKQEIEDVLCRESDETIDDLGRKAGLHENEQDLHHPKHERSD